MPGRLTGRPAGRTIRRVRLLNRAVVERLLDPVALVDAVGTAMADLSAGRGSVPPRIAAVAGDGILAAMPGHSPGLGMLAAKLLTLFPGNAGTSHPTHQAVIAVFDPETGAPVALLDGDAITAVRTAAGSALSVRLLARPDARVLAVVGTGVQARAHALLVPAVRTFDEVRVAGRDPERAGALARDLAERGLPARAVALDGALEGADVVCATTSATEPVVRRAALAPGTHVASVGYVRDGHEVDRDLVADALVVVEHRETVLQPFPVGAAEIAAAVADGAVAADDLVEIGELVAGTRTGRTDDARITLYKSVGLAAQDAAAAAVVLAAAADGDGVRVDW